MFRNYLKGYETYPLGEGEEPGPDDTQAPTAKIDLKNISEGSTTTAAVDFNMVFSPDTALKTAPWYFIDSSKNTRSDGGVSFLLPKEGNKATAFNLSETGVI